MNEENPSNGDNAIRVRMPREFKAEVEELAGEMHIGVSALTRLALGEFIKNRKAADAAAEQPATA